MILLKKIVLYLFGLLLLIFGNKKEIDTIVDTLMPTKPEDVNKNVEEHFEVQKLSYDKERNKLINNTPYFEVVRVGEVKSEPPKVQAKKILETGASNLKLKETELLTAEEEDTSIVQTTIEPDNAETATATQ